MITVYFQPLSGSVSGSGITSVYTDYTSTLTQNDLVNVNQSIPPELIGVKILSYENSIVAITGSSFLVSESVGRVNIYNTSSVLLASFPYEITTIIYLNESGSTDNQYIPPTPSPSFPYIDLDWSFTTSTLITSSLNQLAIYSGSTPVSYSVYESGSSNSGFVTLDFGTTYSIHVSGGGTYYTTSLKLEDAYYGNLIAYLTGSNTDVTYSLANSDSSSFANYRLTTTAKSFSGMLLEYGSSVIPVANSGSVSEWNSLLGISASIVNLSGNNVYLLGDSLTNGGSLIISSSVSSSVVNGGLKKLSTFGVGDLAIVEINSGSATGSLTECPSFPENSISTIIVKYQKVTGSAIDPLTYRNPVQVDCSYNQLSGSIPTFTTQSSVLSFYNCSNNALTGSIPGLFPTYNLIQFDCSNNQLSNYISGSIPNSLTYFNAENNLLSQSVIEGIVKDVYQAGAFAGYLNLSGSGNATVSVVTLETASLLEINRGWEVYLNGSSVIISASFSDNLGGLPMFSSSYYRFTDTDIPFTYLNLTGTGSIMPYSTKFTVSDNHIYEVSLEGLLTGSLSELNYTSSLEIIEISASVSGTVFDGIGSSAPLTAYFTGSQYSTYKIIGSLEYNGSFYEDYLIKYAEAVGL